MQGEIPCAHHRVGDMRAEAAGVAGISQVDQAGKNIPCRKNRDAKVTSVNRRFSS